LPFLSIVYDNEWDWNDQDPCPVPSRP
jgi:hypothetical protein